MKRIYGLLVSMTLMVATVSLAANEERLLLRDEGVCVMGGFDADGELVIGGEGEPFHTLIRDDLVLVKCKGEGLTNESGQAQSVTDLPCGILLQDRDEPLLAESGSLAVSTDGVGTATCKWEP
jgi:hypothetical protein